jgi:hypothetical protein
VVDALKIGIPAIIALISLGFNWYQWSLLQKEKQRSRIESDNANINSALISILAAIKSTNFFATEVRNEYWGRGFESLERIRAAIAEPTATLVVTSHDAISPPVRAAIRRFQGQIADLIRKRDSYDIFVAGRKQRRQAEPRSSEEERDWNDKLEAENALRLLQSEAESLESIILDIARGRG